MVEEDPTAADAKNPAASAREIKALAHPLRLRILRLCGLHELTNKELADRLGQDPGTVLYHVRQLHAAGFLERGEVRTGASGALEKPYRSTGRSWSLDTALSEAGPDATLAPLDALRDELVDAGPDSLATLARFVVHLSPNDAESLISRVQAVLDEFVESDRDRPDQPAFGGMFLVHRSPD